MNTEEEVFELSDGQKMAIKNSREEIRKGNFHKNEEVISEMRQWLNENEF